MKDRPPTAKLRKGWTTGACATAAAAAAYRALLSGGFEDAVSIPLPRGLRPRFALSRAVLKGARATAGVVKDAGDDPDVTHGAEIVVTVDLAPPGAGIAYVAGPGVGTATRPGLPVAAGEPAINPAPRRMIAAALAEVALEPGGGAAVPDATVTISIPGGQRLATKTLNGRLGIVGGLSILGTTGVVIPYSCSSWLHTIRCGIDVARASGIDHVAAATGRTSEAAVARLHGLPEVALIEMGDFAGGLLKAVRNKPVARLTVAGGFAKLCKLAQGHLNLHSSASRVDMAELAGLLESLGADPGAVAGAAGAGTAAEVLEAARSLGLPLGDLVARRAREVALATLSGGTAVDVLVFDSTGVLVGRAGP